MSVGRSSAAMGTLVSRVRESLPEGRAIAEEVWQRRHHAMILILWVHVVFIFFFAIATRHGAIHGSLEAGLVAVATLAARFGPQGRRFRSVSATLGLISASAILVHLSGGLIEWHFHYFFALAVISLYHDWAPFLTAIGFVALQHGVMGAIDPHAVYSHADAIAHPWKWAGIHATFVLATSVVSLVRWKSSEVEALKDPLTWLPNRALFGDRLRQAIVLRRGTDRGLAVLFLDVDDFKSINDTAGHAAGDRLLIVVADRLREAVRPEDTVARLGGDEFAIVLEDAENAMASSIAERILEALRAPLVFEGRQLSVTASIGIALRTGDESSEAELVRNADIAMYVSKKLGKGRSTIFEPSMYEAVMQRTELAKDLEGAVERGEMQLVYQPVNELADRRIAGFEALIRWEHPRDGTIGPMRFIPLAEETGDIIGLGRWVMRTACLQAKAWSEEFPDATRWMSVNVSVRQLNEPNFVDDVLAVLEETSFDPSLLVLEITEGVMFGEGEEMVRQLHRLKSIGVKIALDDFGTGYSSLGYLRRLPIDILKIDKTFVDGADRGPEDAALARAIIKIAESMGLECIAEGVEREEQAYELRVAGCKLAQGYYFSKPLEPHRIDALLLWRPSKIASRGCIVVADNDAAMRELVALKLRDAGFGTIQTNSGRRVLQALDAVPADLVVISSRLADMTGTDLAEQVRERSGAPILFLSDVEATQAEITVLSDRRGVFLQTPFGSEEVLENVVSLVGESGHHSLIA